MEKYLHSLASLWHLVTHDAVMLIWINIWEIWFTVSHMNWPWWLFSVFCCQCLRLLHKLCFRSPARPLSRSYGRNCHLTRPTASSWNTTSCTKKMGVRLNASRKSTVPSGTVPSQVGANNAQQCTDNRATLIHDMSELPATILNNVQIMKLFLFMTDLIQCNNVQQLNVKKAFLMVNGRNSVNQSML